MLVVFNKMFNISKLDVILACPYIFGRVVYNHSTLGL